MNGEDLGGYYRRIVGERLCYEHPAELPRYATLDTMEIADRAEDASTWELLILIGRLVDILIDKRLRRIDDIREAEGS